MSTHAAILEQNTIGAKSGNSLFAGMVGFFFVFRVALTFLFFQGDPVAGSVAIIGCDLALLYAAIFYSVGEQTPVPLFPLQIASLRWIFALLAFALASLLWTGAKSTLVAFAYWAGMAADVFIALLLVQRGNAEQQADGILEGAVWGASALAVIAWCSPLTEDLRLGNDAFLHPNTLGLQIGTATLIAQYLAPRGKQWKLLGIVLAITLLRTLSKTAIIAFVVAECWYLLQNKRMTRGAKMRLTAATAFVVALFWGVLSSYIDIYNNAGSGNQAETLTGRTVLWATAFSMSMERPWIGHGIDSFRAMIPAFGDFQAVHAHNELLQQFFEYGLAGLTITAGVYGAIYHQARRAPPSDRRTLALTLLIFTLLHGLTDTTNFELSYPLWLLVALSVCLARSTGDEVLGL